MAVEAYASMTGAHYHVSELVAVWAEVISEWTLSFDTSISICMPCRNFLVC